MSDGNKKNKSILNQSLVYVGKLVSAAVIVVLFIVAAFLIYYVVTAKVQKSQNQEFNPMFTLYTIVSGSMEPAIKVYDVILTKRVDDPSTIKVGDVITFLSTSSISKDMIVTHRVLEVRKINGKFEYVTKGDNNPTADSSTAKEDNLIGKTVFKVPQLGRLQFFIATKMGWFIVVLVPALGIIIYDILKLTKLVGVKKISENLGKKPEDDEEEDVTKKDQDKKINDMFSKIKQTVKTPEDEERISTKKEEIIEDDDIEENVITEEIDISEEAEVNTESIEDIISDNEDEIENESDDESSLEESESTDEEVAEEDKTDKNEQKYRFFGDDNDLESYAKEEKEERMTSEETKTRIEGIVTRYYEEYNKEHPKSNNKPRSNNKKTNTNNRSKNSKSKNNNRNKNNNNKKSNYKGKSTNNKNR